MPADPGYKKLKATDVDDLANAIYRYAKDGESLIGTFNRIVSLFHEYGRHGHGCSAELGKQYRCRCGFDDAKAEIGPRP